MTFPTRRICMMRLLLAGILLLGINSAIADLYDAGLGGLGITGVDAAAQVGSWPLLAEYSWLNRDSTGLQSTISWRLHPGTDGGIIFFLAQPPGMLTSVFIMLNLPTALYSVGDGITINGTTIDMSNLRKTADGVVLNIGSGPGVDPLVPLVADITALQSGQNGWQINADGSYNLLFNTIAECAGCHIRIYLYGIQSPRVGQGDITLDRKVDLSDALLAERYLQGLANLSPEQIQEGDLAPVGAVDGKVTLPDLVEIIKHVQRRY